MELFDKENPNSHLVYGDDMADLKIILNLEQAC